MDSDVQDRALPVSHPNNERPQAGQPRPHTTVVHAQNECINRTGMLTAPASLGCSLEAEKRQAATCSFEPLIDSSAAAELLNVHRKTLERMALRGEIPGHKVGKFWRFRASELDEWLRSGVNSGRQPCCTTTF